MNELQVNMVSMSKQTSQVHLGNGLSRGEKQMFRPGDFVLLRTKIHCGEKVKYVGPFKIVEERISTDQRYFRLEAPGCLGLSNRFFDDTEVVLFQRGKVTDTGEGDKELTERQLESKVGDGEKNDAFICKRHRGSEDGMEACQVAGEEKETEEINEKGVGQKPGGDVNLGDKASEPSVKLETPDNSGPSRTPQRRTSRSLENTPTGDEEGEDVRPDKQHEASKVTFEDKVDNTSNLALDTNANHTSRDDGEPGSTSAAPEKPDVHIIDGEVEYEVEKILADRRARYDNGVQRMEYLVKWKGYPESEATWEPRSNLTHVHRLLSEFTRNKRRNRRNPNRP